MASRNVDKCIDNKCYDNLVNQALERNNKSMIKWSNYKNDLEVTKSFVNLIRNKIKHSVLVPMGTKALMRGEIVHTNEFLVNLGETWFVKRTAHQTAGICDRRIKSCHEMLEKLEKERELIVSKSSLPVEQEAFGSDERPEIIEYVSEQENEEWKKQHRIKEKKYRQQLAELRKSMKNPIENEEDLWKHLDVLELQEELEDELNRMNAESSIEEDISDDNLDSDFSPPELNKSTNTSKEKEKSENESKKVKKRVYFACDLNSSDDEPLLLEIKHSKTESIPVNPDCKQINSPADIYHHHFRVINREPLSALKNKIKLQYKNNVELFQHDTESEDYYDEANTGLSVCVRDVSERSTFDINNINSNVVDTKNKKISKFKSSRKKNS